MLWNTREVPRGLNNEFKPPIPWWRPAIVFGVEVSTVLTMRKCGNLFGLIDIACMVAGSDQKYAGEFIRAVQDRHPEVARKKQQPQIPRSRPALDACWRTWSFFQQASSTQPIYRIHPFTRVSTSYSNNPRRRFSPQIALICERIPKTSTYFQLISDGRQQNPRGFPVCV